MSELMTGMPGGIVTVALTASVAVAALFAFLIRMIGAQHGAAMLSILPSVVLPLIFPRVGLSVRDAVDGGKSRRTLTSVRSDFGLRSDLLAEPLTPQAAHELRRANERLTRELEELRAAYGALAAEAAERAEAADRLNYLAYHDALTTLPNRVLLMDRLTQALAGAKRDGSGVIVVYLDLDNFKDINDTLGHAAGDRVLAAVGGRLAACMKECDTAGRVGGDEFVVVCRTSDGDVDAARIGSRIVRAIAAPIDLDGTPITIGASLGMSQFPADGSSPAELIESADRAMYSAKSSRRG